MDPPAMLPALDNKAIDGYATSLPFTSERQQVGRVDGGAGEPYGLVYTRPETCAQNRDQCTRLVRALAAANKLIVEQPDAALGLLRKRFDKMDPAVLSATWQVVAQAHAGRAMARLMHRSKQHPHSIAPLPARSPVSLRAALR